MLVTKQKTLRKFWYATVRMDAIDAGPVPFRLLGEDIVLFKTADGSPAALLDRCCHRSAKLSKGWVSEGNIVCGYEVPADQTDKYGIITPGKVDGPLVEVTGLVEKPKLGTAPSNLMIPGRYILQPEVMRVLEGQARGAGNEIQLTDAMAKMIGTQPFHAYTFGGQRFDCGDKAGFITANIALALERADIGPTVKAFIAGL
jgi:UTP-glucose-1-phosphate uridylyltransferase